MNASIHLAPSLVCASRGRRRALFAAMAVPASAKDATEFLDGMHASPAAVEENLEKGRLRLLPARKIKLLCLAGELWITRDGDAEDYILGPGQQMTVGRHDQAAVQALQPSRFRLSDA